MTQTKLVPVALIDPSPYQPRKYFDSDRLAALSASVEQQGVRIAPLVRPAPNDRYELVSGERRLRAAKNAGVKEIEVSVLELSDEDASLTALAENSQRSNLSVFEETVGIIEHVALVRGVSFDEATQLFKAARNSKINGSWTVDRDFCETLLMRLTGRSIEYFCKYRIPLLALPTEITEALRSGKLSFSTAQRLGAVLDPKVRDRVLRETLEKTLSRSEVISLIRELTKSVPKTKFVPNDEAIAVSKKLTKTLKGLEKPLTAEQSAKLLKALEDVLAQLSITPEDSPSPILSREPQSANSSLSTA